VGEAGEAEALTSTGILAPGGSGYGAFGHDMAGFGHQKAAVPKRRQPGIAAVTDRP
jgi:hypothetical protein